MVSRSRFVAEDWILDRREGSSFCFVGVEVDAGGWALELELELELGCCEFVDDAVVLIEEGSRRFCGGWGLSFDILVDSPYIWFL